MQRIQYLLCGWLLSACTQQMNEQPRYEPYEAAEYFPQQQSALTEPEHIVPYVSHQQAMTRVSPGYSIKLLQRGQEHYQVFCAPCHGADGYGNGPVVQHGFPAPPSYHQQRLRQVPEQHFVDVITDGYGIMYSYADRVAPADRWAIAAYIRALQLSQYASLKGFPKLSRQVDEHSGDEDG